MNVVQLLKICIGAAFFGTLLTGAVFMMRSSDEEDMRQHAKGIVFQSRQVLPDDKPSSDEIQDAVPVKLPKPAEATTSTTAAKTTQKIQQTTTPVTVKPEVLKELKQVESSRATSIHVFYYPWYGSPEHDKQWYHWNHPRLPPWDRSQTGKFPTDPHLPPGDVASVYYPSLGPYSSRDLAVVDRHMKWIASAGIDVVVVSWYPKGMADEQGYPWDSLMPALLNATAKYKLKMAFHLEPYKQRTVESVRKDIDYIITNYGSHPAFYRTWAKSDTKHSRALPLFYIYDSYRLSADQWALLTTPNASLSIRDTPLDSLLIGLYVQMEDRFKLKKGGFDGLYTYFASDGFSHGSSMANWPSLSTYCAKNDLLFIPSVGPGYNDTQVRPWNDQNSRGRANGDYYKEHFKMAHTSKADIVSITSFNEWHEGTQIEPAVPYIDANGTDFVYAQYNKGPEQYLEITLEMVKSYFTPHHENIAERVERIV